MVSPSRRKNHIDRATSRLHRLRERRTRRIVNLHVQIYPTRVITRPPSPDAYSPIVDLPPYIDYSHPQFPEIPYTESPHSEQPAHLEFDRSIVDPNLHFLPDPVYYIPDQTISNHLYDPFLQSGNNEAGAGIFNEDTVYPTLSDISNSIPANAQGDVNSLINFLNQSNTPEQELNNTATHFQASQESDHNT